MLRLLPISLRLARFELAVLAALALALSTANVLVATGLDSIGLPAECVISRTEEGVCARSAEFFALSLGIGDLLVAAAIAAPFVVGVVLGAPLVAAELEDRSATVTWSLDPPRLRWLAVRLMVLGAAAAILLALVAVSGTMLEAARFPQHDPTQSFHSMDGRGLPLVAHGLAVLLLSVLIGSLLGRVLPAVLVAAILALGVFVGLVWIRPTLGEPIVVSGTEVAEDHMSTGVAYRRDGRLYNDSQIEAESPERVGSREYWRWRNGEFEPVITALEPDQYPRIVAIEAAGLAGLGLLAALMTGLVVSRRRPYV